MTAPALDTVIVSYNAREDLDRCLASLHDAPPGRSHTIVVVDNASTDGSVALVRAKWPDVRLVENAQNEGFARANNIGIRASSSPLVLLLNGDTVVARGALDRLCGALEGCGEAAAAGPRLVDASGAAEMSFGRMLGPLVELRRKTLLALDARGLPPARRLIERRTRSRRFVDWVSGACLLVWRADAEAVGLLDERYDLYTEDVDFCAALRSRGRRVLFEPSVEVIHLRGRSRRVVPSAAEAAYRRSQLAFYAKHHPGWASWLRRYLRLRGKLPGGRLPTGSAGP